MAFWMATCPWCSQKPSTPQSSRYSPTDTLSSFCNPSLSDATPFQLGSLPAVCRAVCSLLLIQVAPKAASGFLHFGISLW